MKKIVIYSLFIIVSLTSLAQTNACIRRFFCCCCEEPSRPPTPQSRRTQKSCPRSESSRERSYTKSKSRSYQIANLDPNELIIIDEEEVDEIYFYLKALKEMNPEVLEELIKKCKNPNKMFSEPDIETLSEVAKLRNYSIIDKNGNIINEITRKYIGICVQRTTKNQQKKITMNKQTTLEIFKPVAILRIRKSHQMQNSGLIIPIDE